MTDDDLWAMTAAEFTRRIDDQLRAKCQKGVLPWEQPVRVGEIDYWNVHAWAIDRLDELLGLVLPEGEEIDGAWRGRHDPHSNWITVDLMTGRWSDPAACKHGSNIVTLCGHVYRTPPRVTAMRLGQWLGIEVVRG